MNNSNENQSMPEPKSNSYWDTSNMKTIRYTLATLLAISLFIWGFRANDEWYDYGNGLVNLNRVSLIRSTMSITGLDKDGDFIAVLIKGPITDENIYELEEKIPEAELENKNYISRVRYDAKIMFDQFEVNLGGFDERGITYSDSVDIVRLARSWLREVERVRAQVNH